MERQDNSMKKTVISFILIAALCIGMCSCGCSDKSAQTNSTKATVDQNKDGGTGEGNVGINSSDGITYDVPDGYTEGESLGKDLGIQYCDTNSDWYLSVFTYTNKYIKDTEFRSLDDLLAFFRSQADNPKDITIDGIKAITYTMKSGGVSYEKHVEFVYNNVLYSIVMFTPAEVEKLTPVQEKEFKKFVESIKKG